jgi:hypothetical protein
MTNILNSINANLYGQSCEYREYTATAVAVNPYVKTGKLNVSVDLNINEYLGDMQRTTKLSLYYEVDNDTSSEYRESNNNRNIYYGFVKAFNDINFDDILERNAEPIDNIEVTHRSFCFAE